MSEEDRVVVRFFVQPRAKKNQIYGKRDDGAYRIRLTAPPVEGKANKALIDFLANALRIPRSKIMLIAGEKSREKLVCFIQIEKEELIDRLSSLMK